MAYNSYKPPVRSRVATEPPPVVSIVVDDRQLLQYAAGVAADFRAGATDRPVRPERDYDADLIRAFGRELPERGCAPDAAVDELIAAAGPGLMANVGPRFFGFVVGGTVPAAAAADMLAAGWDQNGFNAVLSPAAAAAEACAGRWLRQLLGIADTASVGFVTGGQEANTVGIAAGRHQVLAAAGWDVEADGLAGAPRVRVVAGAERHATIDRTLRLLGLGTSALEVVATDGNGAIDIADLRRVVTAGDGPLIVCLQAGNVNTGACDDLRAACELVHEHDGWVHVDGAIGLWAAASPRLRHLVDGIELADSAGCDGHKWLNVGQDCGFVFCAHPQVHTAAVAHTAPYLTGSGEHAAPGDFVLGASRRARGFAVWAALRQLGAAGVADTVERCCRLAGRFATALTDGGLRVVNDVVLNQVLVDVGADAETVAAAVRADGTCWLGATTWRDRRLLRISVSNHSTTESDVDRSVAAILRAVQATAG